MEDTLRVKISCSYSYVSCWCLNPCFNGRYSQRGGLLTADLDSGVVLILVLMEDTLREINSLRNELNKKS